MQGVGLYKKGVLRSTLNVGGGFKVHGAKESQELKEYTKKVIWSRVEGLFNESTVYQLMGDTYCILVGVKWRCCIVGEGRVEISLGRKGWVYDLPS